MNLIHLFNSHKFHDMELCAQWNLGIMRLHKIWKMPSLVGACNIQN
jgi:hypothetical protein